jgi:hypothetical protein
MKFSIRDLLWVLTLTAVLTAWGVDHWRLRNPRSASSRPPKRSTRRPKGFRSLLGQPAKNSNGTTTIRSLPMFKSAICEHRLVA